MLGNIWNMINSKLGLSIISCLLGIFFASLYYRWKLRKDKEKEIETTKGKEILETLYKVRDFELSTKTIEIYDAEKVFIEKGSHVDVFDGEKIYPAFMTSADHFIEFLNYAREVRENCEKNLDYTLTAYLYYIERYCFKLGLYLGESGLDCDFLGTLIIPDIDTWQSSFETNIVQRINKPTYKVYAKTGRKWVRKRERIKNGLWKKSVLYNLIGPVENSEL